MKVTQVLGHNSNWNVESFIENEIGDCFLITAFTHGVKFESKKLFNKILDISMIDLQFYGKNAQITSGKLNQFPFHPINRDDKDVTSIYFDACAKQAIKYQIDRGFENIIIPLYYENEEVKDIIATVRNLNKYIAKQQNKNVKYFMTLPFANHIIINKEKVDELLFACTDMDICFDGFFITCENKPEFRRKLTTDIKVIRNLSKVFKTLKYQGFETIYAYANWDAILYLAQTDIDYITIGSYENLRNFDIKRFTEDISGGGSKGYYFSEKLLNMIRADDITVIQETNNLDYVKNTKNIFSDIILRQGYPWNIHKPDVNKNYLLAINRLLKKIAGIKDIDVRKKHVLGLIQTAIENYNILEGKHIYLDNESSNYHLNIWRTYLANS